ncbi:MAG: adenylosuccinate synthetase, partial [Saprospiraceae bacterium]|nr:adenylosuccinate synthetase [Saprospiraceae bacterium]
LKGIGPTYMDKTGRNGLRVGDIESPDFMSLYQNLKKKHLKLLEIYPPIDFDLEAEEEKWMTCLETLKSLKKVDGEYFVNQALSNGQSILAEGAQGSMLDIDFGTYPFVTSSNTVTSGVCNGLGVAPSKIGEVIGITKAYCTRVGSGPFPTEQDNETGEFLRKEGAEFGATTGRPRRCGWIDIPQLKYTIMLNGVTQLVVTKIDVLNNFDQIEAGILYKCDEGGTDELPYDLVGNELTVCYDSFPGWQTDLDNATSYEDLPANAQTFIEKLEGLLQVPITMVSTGPERKKLIRKEALVG